MRDFRLSELDLGGFDAESDYKLGHHFVMTPYAREAVSGRRTLFLGRKGSGKSALFRELPRLVSRAGSRCVTVPITPDAYAWGALQQSEQAGYSAAAAHRSAWKLTLAIQLASRLAQDGGDGDSKAGERARRRLTRFVSDNFGTLEVDFRGVTRILRNLRSVKVTALGAGLELVRHEPHGPTIAPGLAERLFDLIGECTSVVPALVLLDRLDEEWDGSEAAQQLLVGLLMAAKEINDRFSASPVARAVRVLVFLRSDIYDALRYDDKDKHRSAEQHLIWTPRTLRELVTRRVPPGMAIDDLFAGGASPQAGTDAFTYLVERTFLRPRELLQFLFECAQRAGPDSSSISREDILEAETQFSRWKLEDLKQEYAKSLPELALLLDALHMQVDRFSSIGELEATLSTYPVLNTTAGLRRLVDMLFDASVIGIQTGSSPPRYKSADPAAVLPGRGTVFIHPALHRSLQIQVRPPDDEGLAFGLRTHTLRSGDVVVAVSGDLDVVTAAQFRTELGRAIAAGASRLLVDLTRCGFIDSAALGAFHGAEKRLAQSGGRVEVVVPSTRLRRMFEITGLDQRIALHASLAASQTPQQGA